MRRLFTLLCLAGYAVFPLLVATAQSAPTGESAPFTFIPTSILNESLPYWLQFSGQERFRFEGFSGGGFQPNSSDAYVMNRLRLDMAMLPAPWLKFRFEMQDARVAFKNLRPYAPPFQDTFDLRLAYVELGDSERMPIGLRVGRQEIDLGEQRLVGSSDWSNTARSFDAARLTLHYQRYRLDAFASSPVVLHDGDVGAHVPGNNLHGLYGGVDGIVSDSKIEAYVLWRLDPGQKTAGGSIGDLDFTTVGVHWVGNLPYRFDYSLEMARQQGSLGMESISAWAGHWLLGYTVPRKCQPRLLGEFNFATGSTNPKDGQDHTFNQLFPSGHDLYGLADQVGWQNIVHARTGVEIKPVSRWKAAVKFSGYWLADPHDALYSAAGAAVVQRADGSAGRFVGSEIDESLKYTYSKQLQIGGGFAHLFTGTFLNRTTGGRDYNYPYVVMTIGL